MSANMFKLGIAVSILVACQDAAVSKKVKQNPKVDIQSFAGLMENTFETAADNTENIIRDRRVRVHSPALDGVWFYTQLNTGSEGKLYRQRLSNLSLSGDGKTIIQSTYVLKDSEIYIDAWKNPDVLNRLKQNDFERFFNEGCEMVWRPQDGDAWSGYVDPKTCIITSKKRNKDIRIESEGYLTKDIYRTNERGYEMDMTFLWGTQPGEYIDLYPLRQ